MIIYNARTLQRWLTFFTGGAFELMYIIISLIGDFESTIDIVILLSAVIGTALLTFTTYFLLIKFANFAFIFDETGFVRKINKKIVLRVKWEDVTTIGTYQLYDFFNVDVGPTFLEIDYYDENHNEQSLNVAFSAKDAKKLKASGLNEKLSNIL